MVEKTDNTYVQGARYFLFGAIPTIVDVGLLWLFRTLFGAQLLLLWTAIAFVVATYVTYLLSIRFVFSNRSMESKSLEMIVFFVVRGCGLGWTELLMWLFAERLDMHYMVAKVIIIVLVFLWDFSMSKVLLFRNSKK